MGELGSSWARWGRSLAPLAVIAGSVFVYQAYGHRPPVAVQADDIALVADVVTIRAELFDGTFDIVVEGVARPFRQVTSAAEVAGRVLFKSDRCQDGNYVQQGELLLEIDPADYQLAVDRARQELAQTEVALREWTVEHQNVEEQIKLMEEDVRLAESDAERIRQLAAKSSASAADVDRARRSELTARNALLTLNNQLRLLDARYERAISARELEKAQLRQAELNLQRTKIVAPCSGTIVRENVEKDAYVQTGATVFVMNDTSAGEVQCQLELNDMYWLWRQSASRQGAVGGKVTGASADPSGDLTAELVQARYQFPSSSAVVEFPLDELRCTWDGKLARYGGEGLDLQTRTVPCVVEVAQPQQGRVLRSTGELEAELPPPPLTPGMFVTVRVPVDPAVDVIRIPVDGLRTGGMVWVYRDGVLRELPVRVARRVDRDVLLYVDPSGPQVGDEIIVSPLAFPRDGMAVRRKPAA
ncbi:MAG: hypothetical protein U0795_04030 [Pirellulales bacterium]